MELSIGQQLLTAVIMTGGNHIKDIIKCWEEALTVVLLIQSLNHPSHALTCESQDLILTVSCLFLSILNLQRKRDKGMRPSVKQTHRSPCRDEHVLHSCVWIILFLLRSLLILKSMRVTDDNGSNRSFCSKHQHRHYRPSCHLIFPAAEPRLCLAIKIPFHRGFILELNCWIRKFSQVTQRAHAHPQSEN